MISIIIPILNEEKAIGTLLEHLKTQEGEFEVIVVDGGSEDRSVEIARQFAPVICAPPGRASQMNAGAQMARGDILLFLHADTYLPPQALQTIAHVLSDPHVVGGRFKVRLDNPRLIYRIIAGGINSRDRLTKGFTGDQAIFIRKSTFEELGGYQNFPLMEDLDLARRMRRWGKVVQLPLAVTSSARRWEQNGVWRTIFLMWMLRALYLLGVSPGILKRFYDEAR